MAEPTVPVIDWAKAKAHIETVVKAALLNAGKVNHNPYSWLRDNVSKLQVESNDIKLRSPGLYASIMALPTTPDTRVNKLVPDKK